MYYENFDRLEKIQGKDTLLVCIGDSWTWGDSLSELLQSTRHMHEDILMESKHSQLERKEQCFGNRLSKLLDSDWLNIACPGESNFYIISKLQECLENRDLQKYKKIHYVIVLTETGRELNKINRAVFNGCTTLNEYMQKSEEYIFSQIENLNVDNITIVRNFTKSFRKDTYKSWTEINGASYDTLPTGFITQKAYRDNKSVITKIKHWKRQLIEQYNMAEKIFNFLNNSNLHHQKSTKHPTAQSHKMWADYLFTIIQDKK